MLPPELRLSIYEYLVVATEPLKGRTTRSDHHYGLDFAILRTNRQIYDETRSLFFGKNTFHIASIPTSEASKEELEVVPSMPLVEFEPPLRPSTWPLLRHLTVDLIYLPPTQPKAASHGWRPADPGAQAYITALTTLLQTTGPKLLSFSLTANVDPSYDVKKSLTSFFICDRDRRFARTLAGVSMDKIAMNFEFEDCYWRQKISADLFLGKSILLLACQVFFCQSQVKIDNLLKRFEREENWSAEGEKGVGKTDLGPRVGRTWPGKSDDIRAEMEIALGI